MCTITLFPLSGNKKGFVLTSNRDEVSGRQTLPPDFRENNGRKMLFPKDSVAGGTWIGVSDRLRLVCLMNGGFEKHQRANSYRKSRGIVVKDLLAAETSGEFLQSYEFYGIEPFTIVLVDWKEQLRFMQVVWDGQQLHSKQLPLKLHIWSSAPLYSPEMREIRHQWLQDWTKKEGLSAESMLRFHHKAGVGDKELDLIIDRGFLKTQSISQVIFDGTQIDFRYEDLNSKKIYSQNWSFSEEKRIS
ncbi:MAG: NRDE family protein [Salegentibacter sp.]